MSDGQKEREGKDETWMLRSSRLSLAPSPYRPLSYFKSEMAGRIKNLKLGLINIINYILYILANKF